MNGPAEITELLDLSARLGRDPLQVQASSGNTSIKIAGTLWIKASGKWLAHAAEENILMPLNLADVRRDIRRGVRSGGDSLGASIETSMHAVLPHRVVIHTHSVNTIAWAVRRDGAERLVERLAGLRWRWIPYVPSGLPLARAIEDSFPAADIFVLGNHGLIVCAEDCKGAAHLLSTVEKRLQLAPRDLPDQTGERIIAGGVLYPCQSIFLSGLTRNGSLTRSQRAVFDGLVQVARRVPQHAPIRYLSDAEVAELLTADAHGYRQSAEMNAGSAAS